MKKKQNDFIHDFLHGFKKYEKKHINDDVGLICANCAEKLYRKHKFKAGSEWGAGKCQYCNKDSYLTQFYNFY